ncbi:hypothetical protein D3C87_436400 [compost metagenome]
MRLIIAIFILSNTFVFGQEKSITKHIEFDHLYFVVPDSVFQKVVSDSHFLKTFTTGDKGWPKFEAIDSAEKKEVYFRLKNSYFELLSDQNKWKEPLNKIGIGWASNKPNSQEELSELLKSKYPEVESYDEKDSQKQKLHTTFYIKPETKSPSNLDVWVQQFYPLFIENNFGKQTSPFDITGKKQRAEKYYSKNRIAKEITDIGLMLDSSEFEKMSKWLQTIGYKSQPNKKASIFRKGKMTFSLVQGKENRLWYLQFKNNFPVEKSEIKFSSDSKIEIEKDRSTWWFYSKD